MGPKALTVSGTYIGVGHQYRAFAYTQPGDDEKALQDFERAVELGADRNMLEETIAALKR